MKRNDNIRTLGFFVLIAAGLSACGDSNSAPGTNEATRVGNPPLPQLALANITAVGLVNGAPKAGSSNREVAGNQADSNSGSAPNYAATPLIGIRSTGESIVIDDKTWTVQKIKGVVGGFLMEGRLAGEAHQYDPKSLFFARVDGKVFLLTPTDASTSTYSWGLDSYSGFVGQSDARDLYFANGDVFRFSSAKMERLAINLEEARIQTVSGNHLVLSGKNGIYQIFNAQNGKRFNIETTSGASTLNATTVWISSNTLLNTVDGTISKIDIGYSSEKQRIAGGVIATTAKCGNTERKKDYLLCFVHEDLTFEPLTLDEFSQNAKLQASGAYVIAQELTSLYAVKRGSGRRQGILQGYNVLETKLSAPFVYYRAETTDGKLVTAVYDIDNNVSLEVKDWSSKISQVEAILQ